MDKIKLFRKRFMPDEIIELKDDTILMATDDVIVTRWNVLKPRKDISTGISAYFLKKGIKVSKVFDRNGSLVYWYCDIIETIFDKAINSYTFNDLLIDVLVYPDGHVEVVDMDEFADIMEKGTLSNIVIAKALRTTDSLLKMIYSGHIDELTKYISDIEKKECDSK